MESRKKDLIALGYRFIMVGGLIVVLAAVVRVGMYSASLQNSSALSRAPIQFTYFQPGKYFETGRMAAQAASYDSGMIAHWALDDGSGTTAADSTGSFAGTLTNSPSWVAGHVGSGAVSFNGTNNKMQTGVNPRTALNNADFSISIWANPSTLNFGKFLFSASNQGSQRFYLREDTGSQITVGLSGWNQTTSSVFSTGSWHHFVLVLSGGTGQLYHNGTLLMSGNVTADMPSASLSFGADEQNTSSSYFAGSLDDIRVYNRALSSVEVSSLYSAGGGSPPLSSFTLTVSKSGTGSGTVTGGSVNCGSTCTMSGSGSVSLSAVAASGSTFAGWSGGGCSGTSACSVTLSSNQTVTATFNTTQNNPPPNPGDTTPPVISAVTSTGITSSGATITWTTDEVADSQVQYGLTTSYGSNSPLNSSAVTTHSVTLTGLSANSTYHFTVASADPSGNKTTSGDNTFTTPAGAQVNGSDVTAASCSWDDIRSAVDQAQPGDTVHVPAGTCTWTKTFLLNKAVTLMGAGMDVTTIVNAVPNDSVSQGYPNNIPPQFMKMGSNGPGLTRITGFTFDAGPGAKDQQNNGQFWVSGSSPNWRIDHNGFVVNRSSMITVYQSPAGGLIDHNRFVTLGWYMSIYGQNGGGSTGDASWAQPSNLGTSNALYIEDNTFTSTSADGSPGIDGWTGEKVVARYNTFTMTRISNHGTETSTRLRSGRTYEFYNNVMNYPGSGIRNTAADAIQIRGGTGVIFNNTVTGQIPQIGRFSNYRDFHAYWSPFNQCNGYSAFDKNDVDANGQPVIYDTGTASLDATYANNAIVLTSNGKSWTTGQWYGYSVMNTRSGLSSIIKSNTSNTITAFTESSDGTPLAWRSGDGFKIVRALYCMDQVGLGQGNLLSNFNNPTPATWVNQVPDPAYAWNNSYNGTVKNMYSDSPHILINRDLFVGTCKPGYTPYTYPHPLTGLAPQSTSLNCGGGGGAQNYTLTVTKSGSGTGTVSGGSISCGSTCSYTGSGTVILTATASNGSTFSGWSGGGCTGTAPCTVSLTAGNIAITATFAPGTQIPNDTVPPVISSISTSGLGMNAVTINWVTDEAATGQLEYGTTASLGNVSSLASSLVTSHSISLASLTANTTYHFKIHSKDAANNEAITTDQTFTTLASIVPDTTAPSVSITAPSADTTISGIVNLSAAASDNIGVAGVQFRVDGSNLGPEVTIVPYAGSWDTTGMSNGTHTITAVARDAAGNRTTSSAVTITVSNIAKPVDTTAPSTPTGLTATAVSPYQINLSWNAATDDTGVVGYKIVADGTPLISLSGTSYSHTGLASRTTHTYMVAAYDAAGNLSSLSNAVSATTMKRDPDTLPPLTISNGSPWQSQPAGTDRVTLAVSTNRNATCSYGTSQSAITTQFASTGGLLHTTSVTGLKNDTTYTYYVSCTDPSTGETSPGSYFISFSILGKAQVTPVVTTVKPTTPVTPRGTFTPVHTAIRVTSSTANTPSTRIIYHPVPIDPSVPLATLDLNVSSWAWLFDLYGLVRNVIWSAIGM